jgi:hypothetical protein
LGKKKKKRRKKKKKKKEKEKEKEVTYERATKYVLQLSESIFSLIIDRRMW